MASFKSLYSFTTLLVSYLKNHPCSSQTINTYYPQNFGCICEKLPKLHLLLSHSSLNCMATGLPRNKTGFLLFAITLFLTAFDFSILHHHHHKIFATDSKTHLQHRRFKMQLRHTPNGTIYMLLLRRYQVVCLSTRKSLF